VAAGVLRFLTTGLACSPGTGREDAEPGRTVRHLVQSCVEPTLLMAPQSTDTAPGAALNPRGASRATMPAPCSFTIPWPSPHPIE
jgi:hypothetical protein